MKKVHLDAVCLPWPGYPHAVIAGGFCFISGQMALNSNGDLIQSWGELSEKNISMGTGFVSTDALEAPVGSQTWLIYRQIQSIMASLGGSLDDLLRLHIYQKDKRFFPVFEKVRISYEPQAPAPSSGIGVCEGSPDGKAWIVQDGISIAPKEWRFKGGRQVLGTSGALASASHYSQGIEAGPYIFLAGQIPVDTSKPGKPLISGFEDVPEKARFLQTGRSHTDARNGPIASQTWFTYNHIRRILEGAGSGMADIVNVTVFLQDMRDYHTFHEIHKYFFPNTLPALTVTEFNDVGHKGCLIEIEVTAMRRKEKLEPIYIEEADYLKTYAHSALAVIAGPLIFISGQPGVNYGRVVEGPHGLPEKLRCQAAGLTRTTGRPKATSQAVLIFENLQTILKEAGADLSTIARLVVYLEDFSDFIAFDAVCNYYFEGLKPSIACVNIPRVSPFPGTLLSIEAIAVKE